MFMVQPRSFEGSFLLFGQRVIAFPQEAEVGENLFSLFTACAIRDQLLQERLICLSGWGRRSNCHARSFRQINRMQRLKDSVLVDGFNRFQHSEATIWLGWVVVNLRMSRQLLSGTGWGC